MSPGDLLLLWASSFQELRQARVQAAAKRLCAPPLVMNRDDPRRARYLNFAKRLIWNLLRVGHLEELSADRFRMVPPTLVAQEGNRFVFVGARSEALLENFNRASGIMSLPPKLQDAGPSVWRVVGERDSVVAAAKTLNLAIKPDRGTDLLASLPCLFETLEGAPMEGIPDKTERWTLEMSTGLSRWQRSNLDEHVEGIYRTVRKPYQWFMRQAKGGKTLRLNTPERRVAAAWLLKKGQFQLEYSRNARVLSVPAIGFILPLLVDRALILASGCLPERRSNQFDYFEINPERAHHVSRILGAKIKVKS